MDSEGSAKTFNKLLVLKNIFLLNYVIFEFLGINSREQWADLATERERQLTTARANQTTGLTNGRAAN